jgi:site-specific DNA recombinase
LLNPSSKAWPPKLSEKTSIAEQPAAAESIKTVVSIHPAAIKNYLADVVKMRQALDDEDAAERPELIAPLRRLIHNVIVHANPSVKDFEVDIKGRLQELLGAPFLTRSVGGNGGSERGTRTPDPRIMIPVL